MRDVELGLQARVSLMAMQRSECEVFGRRVIVAFHHDASCRANSGVDKTFDEQEDVFNLFSLFTFISQFCKSLRSRGMCHMQYRMPSMGAAVNLSHF